MRKRSKSREFAVQILYQMDITHDAAQTSCANFWESQETAVEEEIKIFTQELVKGTCDFLGPIDTKISECANNWHLKRMAVVDRNILRLGCYELLFRTDIPPKVSINEAVELAKKYSGLDAGKFVNGILDKIKSARKGESGSSAPKEVL